MGRRWGKSVLGGVLTMNVVRQHGHVAWIVPTYKNGRSLWRWARSIASPFRRYFDISKAERTISTQRGGFFGIYSADNIDAIRGEWFHLVVIDEAARIDEVDWTDAIYPTLADANGDAIFISTPNGKNWFWREWLQGQQASDVIAAWQAPTMDNPNPRIRQAAELVRDRVSERTYRQEWLAEFVEDGGVFRRVHECCTATAQKKPTEGHTYVIGADWGKSLDFTVFTVLDITAKQVVAIDRSNHIDYELQRGRLRALCDCWHPGVVIAESNAMGTPIIEALSRERVPVRPFVTTSASKATIIDALALAFERGDIAIFPHEALIGELLAYETERLSSGLLRYTAPVGMHDDTVMSLALAWTMVRRGNSAVGAFA